MMQYFRRSSSVNIDARAIYQNPQLLILDETLNALDNTSYDTIFNNLLSWMTKTD